MSFQTGFIAIRLLDPKGQTPLAGVTVKIKASVPFPEELDTHSLIATERGITTTTGADGSVLVEVPASDDPGIDPLGVTYTLSANTRPRPFTVVGIFVPAGVTVQAADVAPTPDAPQYAVQVTRADFDELEGRVVDLEAGGGTGGPSGPVAWLDITGKPSTFPPSAHQHAATDVTGLAAVATSGTYADLSGKPTIPSIAGLATTGDVATASTADRSRANHTGTQPASTVTGLAAVATSGAYTDLSGKPTIPSIAGLATTSDVAAASTTDRDRANHTGTQVSRTISDFYARGLNITGLEGNNLDGTLAFGTVAQYPNAQATYDNAVAHGHRLVRLPFLWERVQPTVGGALSTPSMDLLKAELDKADKAGMQVALDLKNYGRRFINSGDASQVRLGEGVLTTGAFADLWTKIVAALGDRPCITSWGIMNEPHDMPVAPPGGGPSPANTTWKVFSQAAVTAIRATGDTRDVWIHGDEYSGGWNWTNYNGAPWITDPANRVVYVAHFYFNQTRSGIYEGLPFATEQTNAGIDLAVRAGIDMDNFTSWLSTYKVRGAIGEIGFPSTYDAASWNACAEVVYRRANIAGIPVCQWGTGANLTGSGPGGSYNQDPYPKGLNYAPQAQVDVIEKATNLTRPTPLGSILPLERAPRVKPTGSWDFSSAPTVLGVTLGGGSTPEYTVATGRSWTPTIATTATAALGSTSTLGTAVLAPFRFPGAISLGGVDVEVTTAGSAGGTLRAALIPIGADGLPDFAATIDCGTVASTATGIRSLTLTTPVSLLPKTYWFALAALGSTTTIPAVRTVPVGYGTQVAMPAGLGPNTTNIQVYNVGGVTSTTWPTGIALGQGTILMAPPKFWLKAA